MPLLESKLLYITIYNNITIYVIYIYNLYILDACQMSGRCFGLMLLSVATWCCGQ